MTWLDRTDQSYQSEYRRLVTAGYFVLPDTTNLI